jgi:hypothetical protein
MMADHLPRDRLVQAANRAEYLRSPYHSRPAPGENDGGPLLAARRRFASKCDVKWVPRAATAALQRAIQDGLVSAEWRGTFPRYAWHRDGDTVYQAVLSNEELGQYHAYPLEDPREWPKGMT